MPTIVDASPKGGVGKSTAANLLMTCLARRGATVTGVDADPNRPQIKWALRAGVRLPQYSKHNPTILSNLSIIEATQEESLITTIQQAAERSQFVVVDMEGVASQAATFAISQADLVIIPCGGFYLDAVEAVAALRVVTEVGKMARKPIQIPAAVLFTKTDPAIKSREFREVERQLIAHKTPLYDVRLHKRDAFAAIFGRGVPLHDIDPKTIHKLDVAIENAEAFVTETIRRLDRAHKTLEKAVA